MVMFFKKEKPVIEFISTVPGLDAIDDLKPRPAKNYIPEWWKRMPAFTENGTSTVKICPSFPNYFDLGFIIPMWSDMTLCYNPESGEWNYSIASTLTPKVEIHEKDQLLNHVDVNFLGEKATYVFKTVSPWQIITKPGWSVLQLPLYYHFNKKWTVMPGVIDTDIHHEINQQVLYFGDKEDVAINAGEPFVLYIPFERKKNDYNVREANRSDFRKMRISSLNASVGFRGAGRYRKAQRARDKSN
jgi:hypothetical protein